MTHSGGGREAEAGTGWPCLLVALAVPPRWSAARLPTCRARMPLLYQFPRRLWQVMHATDMNPDVAEYLTRIALAGLGIADFFDTSFLTKKALASLEVTFWPSPEVTFSPSPASLTYAEYIEAIDKALPEIQRRLDDKVAKTATKAKEAAQKVASLCGLIKKAATFFAAPYATRQALQKAEKAQCKANMEAAAAESAAATFSTEPTVQIWVKRETTGKSVSLDVYPSDTVADVKANYYVKTGVPAPDQRLLFERKQLENNSTLQDYGVRKDSTLHMVARLRAGTRGAGSSSDPLPNGRAPELGTGPIGNQVQAAGLTEGMRQARRNLFGAAPDNPNTDGDLAPPLAGK